MEGNNFKGKVLTGTAAALGTVDVGMYKKMIVDMDLSATTETVSMTGSVDGANFNAAKIRPIDVSTGAVFASGDVKDGLFSVDVTAFQAIKFTKSATTETATVRIGLGR